MAAAEGGDGRVRLLEHEIERLRLLVPKLQQRKPKLIILDLNGLLLYRRMANESNVDRAADGGPSRPADTRVGAFNVWLRPHAASFLDFVLQKFHVAIWSSAKRQNILPLLKLLFPAGDGEDRVSFVWGQSECTDSGESHPDNVDRPLFFKEFSRVFSHPAHRGLYTEANTLLIDDDAYKAELNPPNTCISPRPYAGESAADDCAATNHGGLGPRAELRRWLGRLALVDSVPDFVASHAWPPPPPADERRERMSQRAALSQGGSGAAEERRVGARGNNDSNSSTLSDRSSRQRRPPTTAREDGAVYVSDLSCETTVDSLKQCLSQFGDVAKIEMKSNMKSNKVRRVPGYAFVDFVDSTSAQRAIDHSSGHAGLSCDGQSIAVAVRKAPRPEGSPLAATSARKERQPKPDQRGGKGRRSQANASGSSVKSNNNGGGRAGGNSGGGGGREKSAQGSGMQHAMGKDAEMAALVHALAEKNDSSYASSGGAQGGEGVSVSSEARLEVTTKLRTAALQGDVEGLKSAVQQALRLGLNSEVETGNEKLQKLQLQSHYAVN